MIKTQSQLQQLLGRGMYRKLTEEEQAAQHDKTPLPAEKVNPFEIIRSAAHRLEQIFQGIENASPQVEDRILRLVRDLLVICTETPDAAIGAVHLCHESTYTLCHPIHQACLVTLIGRRMQLELTHIEVLVAAALTANVSMRNLQEQLHKQATPLSDSQRDEIRPHAQHTTELLTLAGIRNDLWLNIIRQHHERADGNGYPTGLHSDQILPEAHILALADQYCAMLSARADRDPLPPHEQLRTLFLQRGQDFNETVCLALIKELGIFPPGTFARLVSGEIGVVVQRSDGIQPIVGALISPRGGAYARPLRRDCTNKEYTVKEDVRWQGGAPLNLFLLWGYA